jgi:phosphoglucosamine mutase
MVTASHNPAAYNGVKLWNGDGRAFDSVRQERVENDLNSGITSRANWNQTGAITHVSGASREHSGAIVDALGKLPGSIRVVLDCMGGAGTTVTPELLRDMGADVVELDTPADGMFFDRTPEPTLENLELLIKTVRDTGADIGIAHDGDADRMAAVDDNGRLLEGDVLLCLFTRWLHAEKVVCPVDTSSVVERNLPDVDVTRTRVGDVYVAEALIREGAEFGGEPSGTWLFPQWSLAPDGPYAAALLCKFVTEHGSLAGAVDSVRQPAVRRGKFSCPDDAKDKAMARICDELEKLEPRKITRIDGMLAEIDNGWMLIRPSGTEPVLRLSTEADNTEELKRLWSQAEGIVHVSLEGLN